MKSSITSIIKTDITSPQRVEYSICKIHMKPVMATKEERGDCLIGLVPLENKVSHLSDAIPFYSSRETLFQA